MVRTNYLICYDITEDPIRNGVASICKDYGLERIQYSVFYGKLSRSQLKEIRLEIKDAIEETNSDIHILQVCASCESNHEVLISISIEEEDIDGVSKVEGSQNSDTRESNDHDTSRTDTSESSKNDSNRGNKTFQGDYDDISEELPYDEGVLVI